MSDSKVKVYKNPDRDKAVSHTRYVPQYQQLNIKPELSKIGQNLVSKKNEDFALNNPRTPRALIQVPYAETTESPIGVGRGPVPNVGNNMEHTWSSLDGEILDDVFVFDQSKDMIDNNDYVTDKAIGVTASDTDKPKQFLTEQVLKEALSDDVNFNPDFSSLKEEQYVVLINNTIIYFGDIKSVEEQVRSLIFGEHEICDGQPVPAEDIVVLKKVKIKVGIFLE